MKTLLLTIVSAFALNTYSQAPTIQWQNLIAGNDEEMVNKTIQSTDGNFFSVGKTHSSSGNLNNYHGGWDGWISKIDVNGNFVWKKTIGGSHNDYLTDIIQTIDGNYIACGTSYSSDGDLINTPYSSISKNIWLLKFNGTGNIIWEQRYGGSAEIGYDINALIKETSDGNLHVFANSESSDQDILNHYGGSNNWKDIVYFKLNVNGTILSQKNFGGSEDENIGSVTTTSDGGFVILGTTRSLDFDVTQHLAPNGHYDAWVFKIDNSLNIVWGKYFLTSSDQSTKCVKELSSGKIMFSSNISNNFVDGTLNLLSSNGNLIWQKNYGGSYIDKIDDFIEINANHILFSGYTHSNDGDVANNTVNDGEGIWIVEVDSIGDIKNQSTFGGSLSDYGAKLIRTIDNQIVVSAGTASFDGDVINPYIWNCFCTEGWIFKLNMNTVSIQENQVTNAFSIYPNPANDILHINTSNSLADESYNIVNTLGQTVLNGKLENERSTIDVQTLQSGIYFLQIGSKQTQSYKIIKN